MYRRWTASLPLTVAVALSGCGGAAPLASSPTTTLPSLSLLDRIDPAAPAKMNACSDGWAVTTTGHMVGVANDNLTAASLDDDGNWRVLYFEQVSQGGNSFTGWRYLSSTDPTHASSVAWSPTASLARGGKVPTVFFQSWPEPANAIPSIFRAQLINGAWQTDAQPIWTASIDDATQEIPMGAYIDDNGHAHVFVNSFSPTIISDVSGKFVATDLKTAIGEPALGSYYIVSAALDHECNEYVMTNGFAASNKGGAWSFKEGLTGELMRADGNDVVHIIKSEEDGTHDLDYATGADNGVIEPLKGALTFAIDVRYGASGDVFVLGVSNTPAASTGQVPPFSLWSNAGGSWTTTQVALGNGVLPILALDGKDQPQLMVTESGATVPASTASLSFWSPCQ